MPPRKSKRARAEAKVDEETKKEVITEEVAEEQPSEEALPPTTSLTIGDEPDLSVEMKESSAVNDDKNITSSDMNDPISTSKAFSESSSPALMEASISSNAEEINSNKHQNILSTRKKCPYLDTINRQFLDFDMEKLCSVTLSNMNVYVCLVCGKFFQGLRDVVYYFLM